MRNRMLWVGGLVLAEVAVCAAILAATWGGFTWARDAGLRWRAFASDQVSVESDEELRFAVSGPATLDLTNNNGAIAIAPGEAGEIVVVMHRQAWGANNAEAQARLAALVVTTRQSGDTVTVAVPEQNQETLTILGNYRADSIAFTVIVPAETTVKADTDFGDVSIAGTIGPVEARTSAGALTVQAVTGTVTAASDFGKVLVEDVTADTVDASSSSGAVTLRRLEASGLVNAETDFGDVTAEDVQAGALTARTSSGAVTLTGARVAGQVSGVSDFGPVRLVSVQAGSYHLHSSSGAVSTDTASGPVEASTDFGDVTVLNAVAATLDLRTSSGTVRFAGSLGSGPHTLHSDFGDVLLSLPVGTRADLDLSTDFGDIHASLPVTMDGGDLESNHWRGTLNGGGPSLTASTSSGSVTLEKLP